MESHGIPGLPEDYDWPDALACVGLLTGGCVAGQSDTVRVRHARPDREASPFVLADVDRTVAYSDGENDERDWIAVLALRDGRFALIAAWCDYTGWDCNSGASDTVVADSLEDLVRLGMSDDEADRLGLSAMRGVA